MLSVNLKLRGIDQIKAISIWLLWFLVWTFILNFAVQRKCLSGWLAAFDHYISSNNSSHHWLLFLVVHFLVGSFILALSFDLHFSVCSFLCSPIALLYSFAHMFLFLKCFLVVHQIQYLGWSFRAARFQFQSCKIYAEFEDYATKKAFLIYLWCNSILFRMSHMFISVSRNICTRMKWWLF